MNYTVNAYPLKDKKYEKYLKQKQSLTKPQDEDVSGEWSLVLIFLDLQFF